MENKELTAILGKKVLMIVGRHNNYRPGKTVKNPDRLNIEPEFIVFDDGKTYIELEEQYYYEFHDCDHSARLINVIEDESFWKILTEGKQYKKATQRLGF